jgi:FkbM family methyltransferase
METFETPYGKITLYSNETYIIWPFRDGRYWDIGKLDYVRQFIDPQRNILEIGAHCGTSTLYYSNCIHDDKKMFVYEPQRNMYNLLVHNITQNNLQHKILPYNKGVFCYNGVGKMNAIDIDGGGGIVESRYTNERDLPCNFGGVGLGGDGEEVALTTIDSMGLDDIGFLHCDAQGAENFIFSRATETIQRCRPMILFEDSERYDRKFYDNVCQKYPEYIEESKFDIRKFCLETLQYKSCIEVKYYEAIDTLLIP